MEFVLHAPYGYFTFDGACATRALRIGNYRTCSLGTDLNRAWSEPSPVLEQTLVKTKVGFRV